LVAKKELLSSENPCRSDNPEELLKKLNLNSSIPPPKWVTVDSKLVKKKITSWEEKIQERLNIKSKKTKLKKNNDQISNLFVFSKN